MNKGTRSTMALAALTALTFTVKPARAAEREALTVVLHVTDFANTDPGHLGRARAEANRIFADIGVRVVWTDIGEGPQARACEGFNLFISLLSPFLIQEHAKKGVADAALGAASPTERHAFIYSARVNALAGQRGIGDSVLLGRVIAHEVGHLLLRKLQHSSTGLMTAGISADSPGMGALFTFPESRSIRTLLKSNGGGEGARGACGDRTAARD